MAALGPRPTANCRYFDLLGTVRQRTAFLCLTLLGAGYMTWYRKLLWLPVLALVLGACAQTQQTELGEPSDDVSAYLSSVADVESTVEDSFDQVSDAVAISYNTREVMFTAIRDVGYEAVVESALTQAEAINPAEG